MSVLDRSSHLVRDNLFPFERGAGTTDINIGALAIAYAVLGDPYCTYSII